MQVLLSSAVMCTYMHVYLDPSAASAYATHWRPQLAAENVVSVSGLNMYTRARIALTDENCAGAVLQFSATGHPCMFFLKRDEFDNLHISCILWNASKQMFNDMRALRTWYDSRFVDDLYGNKLVDDMERKTWDLTSYDA